MQHRIALIEDDPILGEALSDRLEIEGYACDWFETGAAAIGSLERNRYSVVVSDINLPDTTGEAVFTGLATNGFPLPPFVFITGHGAIDQAVRLLKLGAQDYVTKPFNVAELIGKIRQLCERQSPQSNAESRLGISGAMRYIEGLLPRLAKSRSAVLISGESGVGKEEVARALHRSADPDEKTPFVAVNCGAIPETLIESELFGHQKGAFTGAVRDRAGVFEQADGGTLFLDEIGEMPLSMQVKLLRAIQERSVVPVGGEHAKTVDIRLVCATHRDLRALVEQGSFREDLYYRIHVVHLEIPPLRERQEDILWLAEYFLAERSSASTSPFSLTAEAKRALTAYPWPGNIRELSHLLERATILSPHPQLCADDLFGALRPVVTEASPSVSISLSEHIQACEREYIARVLDECNGHLTSTAAKLGISRKNLWEKMRKLGMSADQLSS